MIADLMEFHFIKEKASENVKEITEWMNEVGE